MPRWLTEDALLVCSHEIGHVQNVMSQNWVTVEGRRLQVETDPEGRTIKDCPMRNPPFKPCNTTLKVVVGYSDYIRVGGKRVCLETVTGMTDGFPPVPYHVRSPGQDLVRQR
jgi:hypothetical protein